MTGRVIMKSLKNYIRRKPHIALSIPAVMCATDFLTDFLGAAQNVKAELDLVSSLGGIEAMALVGIMMVLRKGKCDKCQTNADKK